jgi:hypothetical protein
MANLGRMDKGIDDCDNAIEEIYSKRVNNVVTTNEDTFLAGPVGKNLQDQISELNKNLADMVTQGAWTPVINVDISYGAQFGRYVKIGKQLTLYFYIYGNVNSADTGMVEISGLPFPAVIIDNARFSGVVGNYNIGSMAGTLTLLLQDKWQFIRVIKNGKEMLNKSDFAIGTQFIAGQVTYLID